MDPSILQIPYNSWTPGQWPIISEVVSAFSEETPYVLLEAPTGVGKSVIALAVSRLLGLPTVALTGTLQLQDQYESSLALPTARGRSNFLCNLAPQYPASEAPCTYRVPCDLKGTDGCDYYRQKATAERAPESVLNYQYWLAQANYTRSFRPDGGEGLLVCDEAHSLDEEIRRFASIDLSRRDCREVDVDWPADPASLDDWLFWAADLETSHGAAFRATLRMQGKRSELDEQERQYLRAVERVSRAVVALLNPRVPEDGWVIRPWSRGGGVELKPVWVQPFTPRLLLGHASRILFMTATVLSKELWCYQLGIDPDRVAFIQVPSPFPVENRPLIVRMVGKVKKSDAVLERLVAEVDRILDEHPGERGLIHCVSYWLAQYICLNSRHTRKRLVTHSNSREKPGALQFFRDTPGAVFVSPSVTTGVDLPYDLCRFQVIAKLAFPDLGDSQVKKRMKLGPDGQPNALGKRWYDWTTACELVQAYGRGVRAVDDACVTYLLDGNFSWFKHAVRDLLPTWFTKALRYEDTEARDDQDFLAQLRAIQGLPA